MGEIILIKFFLIVLLLVLNSLFSGMWFFQRKQTMLIDAISHAVLPVLVLTFLIVHNLNSIWFLILSVLFSVGIAFLISVLSKVNLNRSQQMIGVFFSGLFALGVVMINVFAKSVHLDADSVLFGALEFTVFENLIVFGQNFGPTAIYKLLFLLILNVVFFKFYQPLCLLFAFDRKMVLMKGFKVWAVDLLQLALMTLNILLCFEVVGVVLTLGLNVLPIMIARFYTFDVRTLLLKGAIISFVMLIPVSFLGMQFSWSISALFVLALFLMFLCQMFLFKKTV